MAKFGAPPSQSSPVEGEEVEEDLTFAFQRGMAL